MDNEQKKEADNKSVNDVTPTVNTVDNIDSSTSEIPQTNITNKASEGKNAENIQITLNIPRDEKKEAITANWIAKIGTFVNFILAILTYLLFLKTVEANQTSRDSLLEAQKAVEQAKRANDIAAANLKFAQETSRSDDSINDIKLELTKKSLNTQIKSNQEIQRQFQIGNSPYLEYHIDCIDLSDKKMLLFNPKVFNHGKYPVIIKEYNILVGTDEYDKEFFEKKCSRFPNQNNLVSINNYWNISTFEASEPFYTHSKTNPLFIMGEIIYKNLLNNRFMKYSFRIKYVQVDAMYYYDRKDEYISKKY